MTRILAGVTSVHGGWSAQAARHSHHHPCFTIDGETALPVAIDTKTGAALAYVGTA